VGAGPATVGRGVLALTAHRGRRLGQEHLFPGPVTVGRGVLDRDGARGAQSTHDVRDAGSRKTGGSCQFRLGTSALSPQDLDDATLVGLTQCRLRPRGRVTPGHHVPLRLVLWWNSHAVSRNSTSPEHKGKQAPLRLAVDTRRCFSALRSLSVHPRALRARKSSKAEPAGQEVQQCTYERTDRVGRNRSPT